MQGMRVLIVETRIGQLVRYIHRSSKIINYRTVCMENKPHDSAYYMVTFTESPRKIALLLECYILEGIIGVVF